VSAGLFSDFADDDNNDAERAEARAQRRRWPHWCEECHGHTGRGSPCAEPPEDTDGVEDES
jgi:hypothetical protein